MSHANREKKAETQDEENMMDKFLDHLSEKYEISKDILASSIDIKEIKYKLDRYKIQLSDVDNEIDAKAMNNDHKKIEIIDISEGIKEFLNLLEKKEEENANNRPINLNSKTKKSNKKQNIPNILNQQKPKNNPAKNTNIDLKINSKINIKYTTSIAYNEGENKMEKQFNPNNIDIDINELKTINDYQLLPKDNREESEGYENYFLNFKNNLLNELEISPDDQLLGVTKFVLFIAFDIIDSKPGFEDLVGIDPLNDYKKYVLKIDNNDPNLFLVSGQIVYIMGELIENGNTIEVSFIKNGYKINEYFPKYEDISYMYQNSLEPYALYCMFGPYFSKDEIDLTVFNNVISEVAKKNPHYFIVNGPFFSTENNMVKYGEIDTEKGMESIINLLKKEFSQTRTKIMICPGISDNENYYPLPQPAFNKVNEEFSIYNGEGSKPEIIFVSNPQIFQFNETFVGLANFDTIKDTIFNSIHAKEINTFDKACEMILYQKNLYPILPNTLLPNNEKNQEKTISVNLSNYKYLSFDENSQPDIILTYSGLKPCAKKIHGTIFINCGGFMKGKNYDQIAKITLHKPTHDMTDIIKRVKVEFIKINASNNENNNDSKKKNN